MSEERWARTKRIFNEALEHAGSEREAYLQRACAEDPELLDEVRAMLAQDASSSDFLAGRALLPAEEPLPESLGPFRILGKLGEGGMGAVYEAEQERPRRRVALKMLGQGFVSPRAQRRLELEGELLARLSHPFVAQVYEVGSLDTPSGRAPFIAMELVRGASLLEHATRERLGLRARVALLGRVCEAVEHAHQRGLIHRDLKPANVLVDERGHPKVLDFGIARVLDEGERAATLATEAGAVIGTLQYMSPEQAAGREDAIDTRSDVYALGVLAYELLAGHPPYRTAGKAFHEALRTVIEQEPEPFAAGRRELAGDLETIVSKALEKEPARRYGSVGELREDLRRHLADEPILAQPPTRAYRVRKFVRRHRAAVAGAAAVLAALLLGIVGVGWQALVAGRRAREAREAAETSDAILRELVLEGIAALDPRELGPDVRAAEIFERTEQRLAGNFDDRPAVEAAVRDALGAIWRSLGDPQRAEPLLRRALELRRGLYPESDARTLETLEHLSACLADLGRSEEALALAQRVYDGRRSTLGEDQRATLTALNDLAVAHWSSGQTTEALERMRRAVERRERIFGPNDADTLSSKGNLAVMLDVSGELEQAEALLAEVLAARRATLPEEHPDVLLARSNLARCQERLGKLVEPERTWRALLEGYQQAYGLEHPLTTEPLLGLAAALAQSGDVDQAEVLMRRARALLIESNGPTHPATLGAGRELSRLLERRGKAEEALQLAEEQVALQRESLPEGPVGLVLALDFLGQALRRAQRYTEARAVYAEAIGVARDHPDVPPEKLAQALYNLGVLLRANLDLPEEAVAALREALAIDRGIFPEGHASLAADMLHLGRALVESGHAAEGEPFLRSLIAPPYDLGPENPRMLGYRQDLADCLSRQGRHAEALELLEQTLGLAQDSPQPDAARAQNIRAQIEAVLARMQPEEGQGGG